MKRFVQGLLGMAGARLVRARRYEELLAAERLAQRWDELGRRVAEAESRLNGVEHGAAQAAQRAAAAESRLNGAAHSADRLGALDAAVAGLEVRLAAEAERSAALSAGLARLTEAIDPCRRLMRSLPAWYEQIASEPGVQLVLRDLIRPGDVCFDVGGFQGDLTLVMSRLTGPRGLVCTFEANPATLPILTNNCIANALFNVRLVHAAVWHRSGDKVRIAVAGHPSAASVVADPQGLPAGVVSHEVETMSLDDFVAANQLFPAVVKMDIEGAEKHALRGFARYLADHMPHLVLEQFVQGDFEALDFVRDLGYRVFCTDQYDEIRTAADFLPGSQLRNVFCIHSSRLADTPYGHLAGKETVRSLVHGEFAETGPAAYEAELELAPGRYTAMLDCDARPEAVVCYQVFRGGVIQGQHYESFCRFGPNCRDLPFHLDRPEAVKLRVYQVLGHPGADPTPSLAIKSLRIDRVRSIPGGYPLRLAG